MRFYIETLLVSAYVAAMDFASTMMAVLSANIITAFFVYGMIRASKIYNDDDIDFTTVVLFAGPLLAVAGAMWVYFW